MARVVVVGGGLAGTAAAARLAKMKHSVTLCEKSAKLGGRLGGPDPPSTVTLPAALRDLFRKSGRPLERELELHPVQTPRRHLFPDGSVLDLPVTGRAEQRSAIAEAMGVQAADAWTKVLDDCVPLWDVLRRHVLEYPYQGPRALGAAGLRRLLPGRSLRSVLRRALPDPRAQLALAATALGPGSDPARAPAYQVAQAYVERTFGRWSCPDGPRQLVQALDRRLAERRVAVELDTEVTGIDVADGAATGVHLAGGGWLAASVVVSSVPVAELLVDPPAVLRSTVARGDGTETHKSPSGTPIGWLQRNEPLGDEPFEVVRYERATDPPTGEQRREGPTRLLRKPGHGGAPVPTRTPIRGLFCAGPSAQPGPGLSYELLGAALVAAEVSAESWPDASG